MSAKEMPEEIGYEKKIDPVKIVIGNTKRINLAYFDRKEEAIEFAEGLRREIDESSYGAFEFKIYNLNVDIGLNADSIRIRRSISREFGMLRFNYWVSARAMLLVR